MFQYTTETIINSNVGSLPVEGQEEGVRFRKDNAGYIIIDGVNAFKTSNIRPIIYKSPYRAAANATATLALATGVTISKGDLIRLTIVLSETGNVRSTIQNAYLHHTKPFHYEIEAKTDSANVLAALASIVKKDMRDTDFNYFKINDAGTKLIADDCYIQFDEVKLERVLTPADGVSEFGGYAKERTENILAVPTITRGDQGAGTVARLVKDLRIPTGASINPFGPDQGGRPVPGGKYTQYLIEYETERRHVAGTVVGSVDRSITSHVFFIESAIVDAWEAMFDGLTIKDNITASVVPAGRGHALTDGTETAVEDKNPNTDLDDKGKVVLNTKTPDVGSVE